MPNPVIPKNSKSDVEAQQRGKNAPKAAPKTYNGTKQNGGTTGSHD